MLRVDGHDAGHEACHCWFVLDISERRPVFAAALARTDGNPALCDMRISLLLGSEWDGTNVVETTYLPYRIKISV